MNELLKLGDKWSEYAANLLTYDDHEAKATARAYTRCATEVRALAAQHERIVAGFRRGVYDAVTETLLEMPENIDIHPEVIRDCIMREIDAFLAQTAEGVK